LGVRAGLAADVESVDGGVERSPADQIELRAGPKKHRNARSCPGRVPGVPTWVGLHASMFTSTSGEPPAFDIAIALFRARVAPVPKDARLAGGDRLRCLAREPP
jgi:hypothetical protein